MCPVSFPVEKEDGPVGQGHSALKGTKHCLWGPFKRHLNRDCCQPRKDRFNKVWDREQVRSLLYHTAIMPRGDALCARGHLQESTFLVLHKEMVHHLASQLIPGDPCKITLRDCRNPPLGNSSIHRGMVNLPSRLARKIRFYVYFRINVSWRSNIFFSQFIIMRISLRKKRKRALYFSNKVFYDINIFYQRAYNTPNHVKNLIYLGGTREEFNPCNFYTFRTNGTNVPLKNEKSGKQRGGKQRKTVEDAQHLGGDSRKKGAVEKDESDPRTDFEKSHKSTMRGQKEDAFAFSVVK